MPLFKSDRGSDPELPGMFEMLEVMETSMRDAVEDHTAATPSGRGPGRIPVEDTQTLATPWQQSRRLSRIGAHLDEEQALLARVSGEFVEEAVGLSAYLVQQRSSMERILTQLETRLLPLRDYVERESENLSGLIADMDSHPEDFVAENFAALIAAQETNIEMTQRSIDQQRNPFIEYFDAQAEALEVALKRFDHHAERLARNLTQQHEILDGLLAAMRDNDFQAVRAFLGERQKAIEQLAAEGVSDPSGAYERLAALHREFARRAAGRPHLEEVLTHAAQSDDLLKQQVKPIASQDRSTVTGSAEVSAEAEQRAGHGGIAGVSTTTNSSGSQSVPRAAA